MGRRPIAPTSDLQNFVTPTNRRTIRKRKISNGNIAAHAAAAAHSSGRAAKAVRLNSDAEEEHDEDSSSNDTHALNYSTKHANNSSILLNSSLKLEQSSPANNESPRPVYTLRPSIVNGTILYDLTEKPWRLGNPIGKGNFGEIFLASDNITLPVTNENAKYVVKIEPHSNGPLFVEIHCLINTAKKEHTTQEDQQQQQQNDIKIKQEQQKLKEAAHQQHQQQELIAPTKPSGIPDYIASGSHFFGDARYRFLVLKRFDKDLHSLIKNSCVSQKSVLTLAIQIVNVLENLHDKGYCHNDVKSQNLMISKCKYYDNNNERDKKTTTTTTTTKTLKKAAKYLEKYEEKQPTTDSGNSSEQEANDYDDDDYDDEKFVVKRKPKKSYDRDDDYECANDGGTSDQDNDDDDDDDDDEDFDDCTTTSNSNSMDVYKTPMMKGGASKRGRRAAIVQYSGSNPVRSCRRQKRPNSIYEEMVNSHYLRPSNKRISYSEFFDEDGVSVKGGVSNGGGGGDGGSGGGGGNDSDFDIRQFGGKNALLDNSRAYERNSRHQSNSTEDDDSNEFMPSSLRRRRVAGAVTNSAPASSKQKSAKTNRLNNNPKTKKSPPKRLTRRQEKLLIEKQHQQQQQIQQQPRLLVEAEHIFLIDFGLASKYIDRGVHRPFIMDQRRAHDGTLEFTSRDAHMGAHSRRSDLECLGYNLLYWSQGFLPWKDAAAHQQQEKVHRAKEYLMTDVREMLKLIYGKDVPKYLGEFLHLVNQLTYHERPHYARYRRLFEHEYRQLGYSLAEMRLDSQEIARDCIRIRKDHGGVDKHDFFEQNNKLISNNDILSIMKIGGAGCIGIGCGGGFGTPFLQERNSIGDRVSPKNLRSKSDKKTARKKKFNWAEVLSQDPDQIARERAEKEFDRELNDESERPLRRYEGNPTYAILELLKKNEEEVVKYELAVDNDEEEEEEEEEVDDDEDENAENDEVEDVEQDEEENEASEASEVEAEVSSNNESDDDESMQTENGSKVSLGAESGADDDDDDEEEEDEEMESDISEASSNSEQYGTGARGRNKQLVQQNAAAAKNDVRNVKPARRRAVSSANSRSSKSTTTSNSNCGTRKARQRNVITKITTRSNGPAVLEDAVTQRQTKGKRGKSAQSNKRGGSGRGGRGGNRGAFAASAAGEVEQQALKQFLYDHHQQQQQQQNFNGKRLRCTQKTDKGGGGGGNGSSAFVHDDDSNSNLMLLNVWKRSNENIYARNAAAAAKSLTVGGSRHDHMVTRHYRK